MDESHGDERQVLSVQVGTARSACLALSVLAETLEDREVRPESEAMELLEGLAFLIGAVGRELKDVQAALADEMFP